MTDGRTNGTDGRTKRQLYAPPNFGGSIKREDIIIVFTQLNVIFSIYFYIKVSNRLFDHVDRLILKFMA
jgi:hypothetical protein